MRLTIVGATGGVGRQLVEQARGAGHDVTAGVRNPNGLPDGVRSVAIDLSDPGSSALVAAVEGADAVISALGARSGADVGVATRGARAIVAAMRESGVRRLLVISAYPVGTVPSPARPHPPRHDDGDGLVIRYLLNPIVKGVFRATYADLAEMEDVVRGSGLDWTIVRPPRLTDAPLTGRYRTSAERNLPRSRSISRADLAHSMLTALEDVTSRCTVIRVSA